MAIVLGLLAALFFGSGDFFGGLSSKRTSVLNVVAFSHLVGLVGVSALAPFLANSFAWDDMAIGVVAGAIGGVGVALLYRGLAIGPMAVVAPLTAITSAAVPATWGVLDGDSLTIWSWIGVIAAVVAIALISIPSEIDSSPVTTSVVLQSLVAGACFGTMFILFDATSDATAPWPVVGARLLTSGVLVAFVFLRRRDSLATVRPTFGIIVLTGLFDTGSNAMFLYATTLGDLTIVAVLSSLYPASTVLLARFVLHERISRLQLSGLVTALVATALIAAG